MGGESGTGGVSGAGGTDETPGTDGADRKRRRGSPDGPLLVGTNRRKNCENEF